MTNLPLEKQVASLELSKQLKEAGYPQEGLFWWAGQELPNGADARAKCWLFLKKENLL